MDTKTSPESFKNINDHTSLHPQSALLKVKDNSKFSRRKSTSSVKGESTKPAMLKSFSISTLAHPHETVDHFSRLNNVSNISRSERCTQKFAFINSSTPNQSRDHNVQKLVKSQARKWAYRNQDRRRKGSDEKSVYSSMSPSRSGSHTQSTTPQPQTPISISDELNDCSIYDNASTLSLSLSKAPSTTPVNVPPQYGKTAAYYLSLTPIILPLHRKMSYNPVRVDWLPIALSDEAAMATLSYATGLFMVQDPRWQEPVDLSLLMRSMLEVLMPRLEGKEQVTDATIFAVSGLATAERYWGNYDQWALHMRGLTNLITTRGGVQTLDQVVRLRACRADIDGSVDNLSTPHLPLSPRTQPSIVSKISIPRLYFGLDSFSQKIESIISPGQLRDLFLDVWRFNAALNEALHQEGRTIHPRSFEEDTLYIQHGLLTILPEYLTPIQRACQVSALVYVTTLVCGIPLSGENTKHITYTLRIALQDAQDDIQFISSSLQIWLYAMGAIASHGAMEHDWFLQQIEKTIVWQSNETASWAVVKREVQQILWIDLIHDEHFQQYWEDYEEFRRESEPSKIVLEPPSDEE